MKKVFAIDAYKLPVEKSEPSVNLADYSILLYGQEKIGKTTFAAQFEDALFLMCEPGGKALSIFKKDIFSWDDFIAYAKLLKKDKRFKTIVVDTVDVLYPMCERSVCAKLGVSDIQDAEWGKGWRALAVEFSRWMSFIQKLDKGVIFISHATEKEIKFRGGGSVHRTVPTMPKGAAAVLEPMVDIWAYYKHGRNGERSILIQGDEEVSAGSRAEGHFLGVNSIPGGKSAKETYQNFVAGFNNKLVAVKPRLTMKLKKIGGSNVIR